MMLLTNKNQSPSRATAIDPSLQLSLRHASRMSRIFSLLLAWGRKHYGGGRRHANNRQKTQYTYVVPYKRSLERTTIHGYDTPMNPNHTWRTYVCTKYKSRQHTNHTYYPGRPLGHAMRNTNWSLTNKSQNDVSAVKTLIPRPRESKSFPPGIENPVGHKFNKTLYPKGTITIIKWS